MRKDLICTKRIEMVFYSRWWGLGTGVYATEYNRGFVPYAHIGPLMLMVKFGEYAMNRYGG